MPDLGSRQDPDALEMSKVVGTSSYQKCAGTSTGKEKDGP